MAILKCKMCGGDLKIEQGSSVCECEYCGTKQTVPNADDEKKTKLFDRANRLRSNYEFDKASSVYEGIVSEFPEEAEGYWGLLLCKFGVEYVDDPATGNKVPTCHRSSFDSVMDDPDFELVMEYSDSQARGLYRDEAKKIEEIRKGIIEVSGKEKAYDVFICYKETDESGNRTIDSVLAQDVYDELTNRGYRVFFSRISLEDKLGVEYEPYIFAALNSAKVMLAFGTSYDNYNAVWVKNEWGRYLQIMARDKGKYLIPCFKDIDAYDMPKEFARFQAQDMGKVGAVQDLVRGVDKLIRKKGSIVDQPNHETQESTSKLNAIMTRGWLALEDGAWEKANKYFDDALNYNAKFAMAYLGITCATMKVHSTEELPQSKQPYENNLDFQKFLRFANEEEKDLAERIQYARNEIQRQIEEKAKKEKEEQRIRQEELKRKFNSVRESNKKAKGIIWAGPNGITCGKRCDGTLLMAGKFNLNWDAVKEMAIENGHIAGMWSSGRVSAVGDNSFSECVVAGWKDIIEIGVGKEITIGLCKDGNIEFAGNYYKAPPYREKWKNIKTIAVGEKHYVAIKNDGTVLAYGENQNGQCDVTGWKNVLSISLGLDHTIGLCKGGTVLATGLNNNGMCDVSGWNHVIKVAAGTKHTVGLMVDGDVLAVGDNKFGQCNTSYWDDITDIAVGKNHTVGLYVDGTVVATGDNSNGQCNVGEWKNVVYIACGSDHTVGLRADGRVLSTDNRYDVSSWRLFENFSNLDYEREQHNKMFEAEKQRLVKEYSDLKGILSLIRKKEIDARIMQINEILHQWD